MRASVRFFMPLCIAAAAARRVDSFCCLSGAVSRRERGFSGRRGRLFSGTLLSGAFPCKRKPGIIIITGAGKAVEQGSVNKVRHFCEFPAREPQNAANYFSRLPAH